MAAVMRRSSAALTFAKALSSKIPPPAPGVYHIPGTYRTFATTSSRSLTPLSIQPSSSEIQARALSLQNLELAVRSVHEDGLVVIENAIPHGVLDHLNEKMVADARMLQARGKDAPFNYNLGNIQQDPPPIREYFERDVFLSMMSPVGCRID
jgi:hypothetical protein